LVLLTIRWRFKTPPDGRKTLSNEKGVEWVEIGHLEKILICKHSDIVMGDFIC